VLNKIILNVQQLRIYTIYRLGTALVGRWSVSINRENSSLHKPLLKKLFGKYRKTWKPKIEMKENVCIFFLRNFQCRF
jgi:hypothetical protein